MVGAAEGWKLEGKGRTGSAALQTSSSESLDDISRQLYLDKCLSICKNINKYLLDIAVGVKRYES